MWHSARASVSYPARNYAANLGIEEKPLNATEKNAVNSLRLKGAKLGNGTFGSVRALGDKYALKIMMFSENNGSDNLKIFLNEIKVGSVLGIQNVGTRIYAWRVIRNRDGVAIAGQYIMDSFTRGNIGVESCSLREYVEKAFPSSCPKRGHPLVTMLRKTLKNFYVLTQGYHADLHTENIAVVYDPNDLKVKRVIIFDYGAHKKFKSKVNKSMCLDDIFESINREYNNSYSKSGVRRSVFPAGSLIKMYGSERSQIRRPNTQMLKGTNASSGLPYNAYTSRKKKESWFNLLTSKRRPKTMIGTSFKKSFLSPRTYIETTGTRPKNIFINAVHAKYPEYNRQAIENSLKRLITKMGTTGYETNRNTYLPGISMENYEMMVKNMLTCSSMMSGYVIR